MALIPGTRLGSYELLALVGTGGMGEVYKARDTRLDRTVAIKILPEALAADPQFRDRFDREARTISQLDHPHICALYDVGQHSGTAYLVMQYLEGETLADRLTKGALPLDQALQVAIQIADALATAHKASIVHRDLKPGNIMLTKAGAKLLDFGLAKTGASVPGGTNLSMLPTTPPITQQGAILGTFQYMAPEQLEGQEADARTDIFAFGAVAYEMVTGKRAFEGKSQASLIAAILEHHPRTMSSVQPVSPPFLDHLVQACLAKRPDERWQSMRDVLIQLALIAERRDTLSGSPRTPSAKHARQMRLAWTAAAVGFVFAGLAGGALLTSRRKDLEPAPITFEVAIPSAAGSTLLSPTVALSPDGKHLVVTAFSAGSPELRIRSLDALDTHVLARVKSVIGQVYPFWSPDSRFVAFFSDGKLQKTDVIGNPPQTLCDAAGLSGGGAWNRQGVILFTPRPGPLFQVADSGGTPTPVTELDATRQETTHRDPTFLPDGKHFLYLALSSTPENAGVYVGALGSKGRTRLMPAIRKVVFAAPNHLLFLRDATLMAQRFDPDRLELQGDPFRVAESVATEGPVGVVGFTVSDQGTLAYLRAAPSESHLLWLDRGGKQIGEVGVPAHYGNPAVSPDAQRLAVDIDGDVWLFDLLRGGPSRFTFDPTLTHGTPMWSHDGSRVAFAGRAAPSVPDIGLFVKNSRGGGQEEILLKADHDSVKGPEDWSPDGRWVMYEELYGEKAGLWALPLFGDRKPQRIMSSPSYFAGQGRFSPDGRWIAYASNESGRPEVYVASFPTGGSKWQVSTGGGAQPRWRRDGKALYFMSLAGEAMEMDVAAIKDNEFQAGTPQKLFQANPTAVFAGRNSWDVTLDGQRFLINSGGARLPLTVVLNWTAALKK